MRERLAGYMETLADAGVPFAPILVVRGGKRLVRFDSYPYLAGIMIDDLALAHGADAVLANDDAVGVRLIKAFQGKGIRMIVKLAVIGYDRGPVTWMTTLNVTTIDHDHHCIAYELTGMLTSLVSNGEIPKDESQTMVAPTLIARGSSVPTMTSHGDISADHDVPRTCSSVVHQS